MTEVEIPYYPRPLQLVLHDALESHRWVVAVCHRRFGKTVLAVNHLIREATSQRRDDLRFAYVAPTYTQGKRAAWDYLKRFSAPIPGHTVNESELRIDYPGGGQVRIYGADKPDSLRGIYLDGVVLDEYGLQPSKIFTEVLRPLLADRLGWGFFIGTPNGKNQFWDVVEKAQNEPGWYYAAYKASETGYIVAAELLASRRDMSKDEYAQEYECSFEASVKGAVYVDELQAIRESRRLTSVPYDPMLPVDTGWDLGIRDSTAIWFAQQSPGGEIRLIDYYMASGQPLPHYVEVVKSKGYVYGTHFAPHDIAVKEWGGNGNSRLEIAASLGIRFRVVPQPAKLQDEIQKVKVLLPRCWFDAEKTKDGFAALQNYRWDYNKREEWNKPVPVHNWASHGADAFRTYALGRRDVERQYAPPKPDIDEYDRQRLAAAGTGFKTYRRGGR